MHSQFASGNQTAIPEENQPVFKLMEQKFNYMFLNSRFAFELELVLLVEGVNKIEILTKLTNILIKFPENV